MKKKINSFTTSLLLLLWISGLATLQAQQAGVNTKNPQAVLHVDAKKDNNPTVQEADDFVVTSSGNVGIGTISPTHKMDIRGKIQIRDGGERTGSVLTSNSTGLAQWNYPAISKTVVNGVFPATTVPDIISDGYTNPPKYSGIFITLSRGKWIVNAGVTFTGGNTTIFQRCYLSSADNALQQNGFTFLGPAGAQSSYGGIVVTNIADPPNQPGQRGFITGSMAIEVTSSTAIIYLLLQNQPSGAYKFNAKNYLENYFFAKPID
ncbi:hypothetical protein ACR79S_13605 [Sphingobacterium spiritivorum]|uniref:hypothetical protein n=1 Tax=Sphingobacterium spiritivorum TaxID=258 RepID=UPI003DA57310